MKIQEYVDIRDYGTLHVGGQFRYFTIVSSVSDLVSVCTIALKEGKKILILGGGSNIVFSDGIIDVLAIKIEIKGFEIIKETGGNILIKVGAGEIWDELVVKTVDMNLSGLEALSFIPGTVGATPVQNVGAYGSEVKDTILEVEVFDIKENKIKTLSNKDCKFSYRDSIFKNEAKGKYVITSVTYRLEKELLKNSSEKVLGRGGREPVPDHFHKNFSKALLYPGVMKYFEDKKIENPSLKQIREAIIYIRKEKLPNPKEIPNVGSFFKNPIVSRQKLSHLSGQVNEKVPSFDMENDMVKISAGWLIENAGLKGKSFGKVSVYDKNALVLVNTQDATFEDIISTRNEIIKIVNEKFGIILEQEPEII